MAWKPFIITIIEHMPSEMATCAVCCVAITMTSQWARWRLKSPASRLFIQPFIQAQIKEKNQISVSLAFVRSHRWILRTKGQYREKGFHLMTSSWHWHKRRHVWCNTDHIVRSKYRTKSILCPNQLIHVLTHWGRDKMIVISQTTFSNAFSWTEKCESLFKSH